MTLLEDFQKETETICHLQNVSRLLGWDQQIVMPKSASPVRGRQQAALSRLAHERLVAPSFGEMLKRVEGELGGDQSSDTALILARWQRERTRATSVSGDLVEKLSLAGTAAFAAWREAKERDDFSLFEPHLEKMFELKREESKQLGYKDHPYDPLLDEFEPGMTTATVKSLFSELREHLARGVALIAQSPVVEQLADGPFDQDFPVSGQEKLARELATSLGYPTENRLDVGAHPFCSANSSHDVRLVTRYKADEVATAIFATLHETGHGLYELHSPDELEYSPLRGGCSLGVHESQSRLWENLVGRSKPYWNWAYPKVRELFPTQVGGYGIEDFYCAANRVRPSLIRVEADEVTYSLHVILRFEIECALLEGSIEAKDIPSLWNQKMKDFLGVDVPSNSQGCLQDIHWSDGLVGYFPTYVLGNLIASDLWTLIEKDLPNLESDHERGNFQPLLDWLIEKVYSQASRYQPQVLLKKLTGQPIRVTPFVNYLQKKYSSIYEVDWS